VEPGKHNFTSARRGLTFIETICAVAILAMVSASVLGAFNSMMGAQERQRHRLGAMELANRLILQYLDDKDTLPQAGLPIVYADERYRWEMKEVPVQLVAARPDVAEDRTVASAISVNRLEAVTMTVWLSEESGGGAEPGPSVPSASLTRLMDPIALRNPDVTKRLAQDPIKQRQLLEKFQKIGRNSSGGKPRTTPGAPGSAPAASPSNPPPPRATPPSPRYKPDPHAPPATYPGIKPRPTGGTKG
jgi:prepilin-type N-terminal cleavage/methylation domain-containing protein